MGLEYTGTDKSSASWSQCVPDPWKWDTWDWSAQGEISPLLPGPSVSQLHGNGTLVYTWRNQSSASWSQCVPAPWKQDTMGLVHSGTGAQRERSVFCVLVPVCPSPMEMVHSGTGTQWDWSTQGEISLLVLVTMCFNHMEMGHNTTWTKVDWNTGAWAQYLISFA